MKCFREVEMRLLDIVNKSNKSAVDQVRPAAFFYVVYFVMQF